MSSKCCLRIEVTSSCSLCSSVIHVSMLKKCFGNQASIFPVECLGVYENLSYEDVPIEILDPQVMRLRNKEVATVKVL